MSERLTGYIRKVTKGKTHKFGFICPDDGSPADIFVFETSIHPPRALVVHTKVEFEVVKTPKGREGIRVVPLGWVQA